MQAFGSSGSKLAFGFIRHVIGDEHAVVVVKTDQMPVKGAIMQRVQTYTVFRVKPLRLVLLPPYNMACGQKTRVIDPCQRACLLYTSDAADE